mmetsp:Transcript_64558/g.75068  ORF Transcript_64558/g.75068 Transcript_64558/m.75068 type:complete len:148 (+) Transcript_64558:808-1251(+)
MIVKGIIMEDMDIIADTMETTVTMEIIAIKEIRAIATDIMAIMENTVNTTKNKVNTVIMIEKAINRENRMESMADTVIVTKNMEDKAITENIDIIMMSKDSKAVIKNNMVVTTDNTDIMVIMVTTVTIDLMWAALSYIFLVSSHYVD